MPTNKILLILFAVVLVISSVSIISNYLKSKEYGAPPYTDDATDSENDYAFYFDEYTNWQRPAGPIRIGLQVGHWKNNELPDELVKIKESGGGTTGKGVPEWEIVLAIAKETKKLLEVQGYVVDLLPATVPESYWADAFVSIHADGNLNPNVRGYKVAAYQRDRTGVADELAAAIEQAYGDTTGFIKDPNISRNMTRYYAFNSRRYKHSIHPMTPGVIVETGFATNHADVTLLLNSPEIPAKGIADGIIDFIEAQNILP